MIRKMLAIIAVLLVAIPAVAGTWTPNNFIYKPSLGARGEAEKQTFDTGLDRIDARLGKEIWVGDPGYGTTLQSAVTAVGGNQALLKIPAGTWSIGANLTIPANITLKPKRGAILSIADGVTLTINGGLDAGLYQIFSWTGAGAISLANAKIPYTLPQWFGVTADGTDQSAALQKCINSANGAVYFPPGNYGCKNINLAANTRYFGVGRASKISLLNGDSYDAFRIGPNQSNITIDHLFFYGDNLRNASYDVGGRGIRIYTQSAGQSNSNITVKNCEFTNLGFGAVRIWCGTSKVWITDNYIHDNGENSNSNGQGIFIGAASGQTVQDINIHNNIITNNGDTGIEIGAYCYNYNITGNRIYNAYRHGVCLYSGSVTKMSSRIIGNYIEGCGANGIYVTGVLPYGVGCGFIIISNNHLYRNCNYDFGGEFGASLMASLCVIYCNDEIIVTDNIIENNGVRQDYYPLIRTTYSYNMTISGNTFRNETVGGVGAIEASRTTKLVITGNKCTNMPLVTYQNTLQNMGSVTNTTITGNYVESSTYGMYLDASWASGTNGVNLNVTGNTVFSLTGKDASNDGIRVALAAAATTTDQTIHIANNIVKGFNIGINLPDVGGSLYTRKAASEIVNNNVSLCNTGIALGIGDLVVSDNYLVDNVTDYLMGAGANKSISYKLADGRYFRGRSNDQNLNWHDRKVEYHAYNFSDSHLKKWVWTKGDIVWLPPAAGGYAGKICTTDGGLYDGVRQNSTAYSLGRWIMWDSGTTIWECTTAGTSAASSPDITGKVVGSTVADGTVVWTMRATAAAVFKDFGAVAP
jgi:hypothetical protein